MGVQLALFWYLSYPSALYEISRFQLFWISFNSVFGWMVGWLGTYFFLKSINQSVNNLFLTQILALMSIVCIVN